jgi:hypothetical protein
MIATTYWPMKRARTLDEKNIKEHEVPDIYADRFNLAIQAFGLAMTFGVTDPNPEAREGGQPPPVTNRVIVRTSLIHAKVMTLLLLKNIQEWERNSGVKIPIPEEIVEGLGLKDVIY